MLKVISLLKRADHLSKADFDTWVVDKHIDFAKNLPGLRKYSVSVSVSEDSAFDSVNELYFDDEEARAAAFATDFGKAAAADAGAHTAQRVHVITTEHQQL
jgi:uncharacterized protein (TIGR02118 family)